MRGNLPMRYVSGTAKPEVGRTSGDDGTTKSPSYVHAHEDYTNNAVNRWLRLPLARDGRNAIAQPVKRANLVNIIQSLDGGS